jgi:hypothetical protein
MRNKTIAFAAVLSVVVVAAVARYAEADTMYGRQCNRVFPTRARAATGPLTSGDPRAYYRSSPHAHHTCAAASAVAEDGRGAGLDYDHEIGVRTFNGHSVTGCVMFDFPLNRGWLLAGIDVVAKPTQNACNRTPCQAPYCGTGGNFVVFTQRANYQPWQLVQSVSVATPNYAEYKIVIPQPALRVMVCRPADGPARDDVLIDSVKGCAVRP